MMLGLRRATYLNNFIGAGNQRFMSVASAASIKDRFQAAYEDRAAMLRKQQTKQ